jgi:hypothetical protein
MFVCMDVHEYIMCVCTPCSLYAFKNRIQGEQGFLIQSHARIYVCVRIYSWRRALHLVYARDEVYFVHVYMKVCVHVYVCFCVCKNTCTCFCVYKTHAHVYTHRHTHKRANITLSACKSQIEKRLMCKVCACVYVYFCVCKKHMHMYTHTDTRTNEPSSREVPAKVKLKSGNCPVTTMLSGFGERHV